MGFCRSLGEYGDKRLDLVRQQCGLCLELSRRRGQLSLCWYFLPPCLLSHQEVVIANPGLGFRQAARRPPTTNSSLQRKLVRPQRSVKPGNGSGTRLHQPRCCPKAPRRRAQVRSLHPNRPTILRGMETLDATPGPLSQTLMSAESI